MKLIFAILLISAASYASAATCPAGNCPLYNLWNSILTNGTYLSQSAAVTNASFCKNIAADSCCDAAKLDQIKSTFDTYVTAEVDACKVIFEQVIGSIIDAIGQLGTLFKQIEENRQAYEAALNSPQVNATEKENFRKFLAVMDATNPKLGAIKTSLKKLFSANIKLGVLMLRTYAGYACGYCDPTCLNGKITNSTGNINMELSNTFKDKVQQHYVDFNTHARDGVGEYIQIMVEFAKLNPNDKFNYSNIKFCAPNCNDKNTTDCPAQIKSFVYGILDDTSKKGAYCEFHVTNNGTCPAVRRRLLAVTGAITYSASGADPEASGTATGASDAKAANANGNTESSLTTKVNFGATGSFGALMVFSKVIAFVSWIAFAFIN